MSHAIPAISIWVESESDRRVGLQSSQGKGHALMPYQLIVIYVNSKAYKEVYKFMMAHLPKISMIDTV